MASRLNLHEELCALLGTRNAYYDPPESVKLNYTCIKYSLTGANVKRANNGVYGLMKEYELIVISRDPDDPVTDSILTNFQYARLTRAYRADNLNHFVYTIYY